MSTKMLTRGQKAALTRQKNATLRAQEQRRLGYQERAAKSWKTRRKNAKKAGLMDKRGQPTPELLEQRTQTAMNAWATRRERYGETGRAA